MITIFHMLMIVAILTIFFITAQAVVLPVPTSDIASNIPGRLVRAPRLRSASIQHRVPEPRQFRPRLNQNRIRVRASNQDLLIDIGDELHDWIRNNNVDRVLNYLQNKGSVQVQSTKGLTPLHAAVKFKQNNLFDMLIENGADINALDGQGRSALFLARVVWNEYAMEKLRSMGAHDSRREYHEKMIKLQAYKKDLDELVPSLKVQEVVNEATLEKIEAILNKIYELVGVSADELPALIEKLKEISSKLEENAKMSGYDTDFRGQKQHSLEEIEEMENKIFRIIQMDTDQIAEETGKLKQIRASIR